MRAEEREEGAVGADPLLVGREVVELGGLGHIQLRAYVERREEVPDSRPGTRERHGEDLHPEGQPRRPAVRRHGQRADVAPRRRAVWHLDLDENRLVRLLRRTGRPVPRL